MLQERVVSTIGLVLERFIHKVKSEVPHVNTVYDELLGYESSINKYRSDNKLGKDTLNAKALPLFAFKRSVLRYSDYGMGKRMTRPEWKLPASSDKSKVFKVVHGEIDVEFILFVKSAIDAEAFEIEYLSEMSIPAQKELLVDVKQDLGIELPYYVEYGPLTDKIMDSSNSYFKSIYGSVKIRGFYPVFKTTSKHIIDTTTSIYDSTFGQIKSIDNRLSLINNP